MTERLDYYDILGTLVPGILLIAWIAVCFPGSQVAFTELPFPSGFSVLACIAASVFVGQMIQCLGSLIEPLLFRSWGGRPSDRALHQGLGDHLPLGAATRICEKLQAAFAGDAEPQSLFRCAMQLSDAAEISRATRFNALYAYHRSLVLLLLIAFILAVSSWMSGSLALWHWWHAGGAVIALGLLIILAWHRAKRRGVYYVMEVLMTAERVLDERQPQVGHS